MRNLPAWAGLAAGLIGLALDFWVIVPGTGTSRSLPDLLVYFWTFFTHLTNLWLLLTYAATLTRARWLSLLAGPRNAASAAAFILLVMLYYHFMLAPYLRMEGALLVATWLLHYICPVLYLVWWAIAVPHPRLRWRDIPLLLVPGIVYVAGVLLRGAVVNEYPYEILDAGKFGYLTVAIGVAVLLIAVSVFSALLILADRWLGRRHPA